MESNKGVKQKRPFKPFVSEHGSGFFNVTPQVGLRVRFICTAALAKSVSVAGTFNNWTPGVFNLKKDLSGIWRGELYLKSGRYEYRFHIDGKWINDPNTADTVPNGLGGQNMVLEVQ